MRPRLGLRLGITLFLASAFAAAALAQESTAELRGRVLDPQGAALAGATLTITNQATGVYRQTVAGDEGTYFVTALSPGLYTHGRRARPASRSTRAPASGSIWAALRRSISTLEIGGLTETVDGHGGHAAGGHHVETDRRQRDQPGSHQPAVGQRQLRRHGRAAAGHRRQHQHRVVRLRRGQRQRHGFAQQQLHARRRQQQRRRDRPAGGHRRRARQSRRLRSSRSSPTSTTPSSAAPPARSSTPSASRAPTQLPWRRRGAVAGRRR